MKLHKLTGTLKNRRTWCGPAALAMAVGVPYSAALDTLKRESGRSRIKGTSLYEMAAAFRKYGFHVSTRTSKEKGRPTFAQWLKSRPADQRDRVLLVNVTNHWILVAGNSTADNFSKRSIRVTQSPHRRKRVLYVHPITPCADPAAMKLAEDHAAIKEREEYSAKVAGTRRLANAARLRCAELGLSVHWDHGIASEAVLHVSHPSGCLVDGDCTLLVCYGWADVLDRLRYVKASDIALAVEEHNAEECAAVERGEM